MTLMGWVNVAGVLFLVAGVFFGIWRWEWIVTEMACRESGSTTLRNLGFVAGGFIAIWVAIWRSVVADRQAQASHDQAKAALRQAETSQRGLLNERYQKGAEMLGSEVLAVRLGGIYSLRRLAEDHPKQYHVQVMGQLCAFVRHPTKDQEDNDSPTGRKLNIKDYKVREDVQEAMEVIGDRSADDVELEKKKKFVLELSGAYLPFVRLLGANLTDAVLINALFYPSNLTAQERNNSNLIFACADLRSANLSNAFLTGADLTGAYLSGVNLTGTQLAGEKGLTQEQLNQACADPEKPPNLSNLRDASTGDLLEWRGKPCGK